MARIHVLATSVALVAALAHTARAAEICGNGIDDDGDGMADEGCYPTVTTGVCESPLSCDATGMVSPSTGSLRYQLPPDVAPAVPYGPGIGFRRIYTSMYAPGGGAPVYRKPLGERWQHTYMTWLDKLTTPNPDQVIIHTNQGQDVLTTYASSTGGWDYYTPQAGYHVQFVRQRQAAPKEYQIKFLTGETIVYDNSGKLTEIWDTLATPNKVLVAYDGNGQVSTVTDASGKRRLLFAYTGSLLTSVTFQILISSVWTTEHTSSYAYTSSALTGVTIGGQSAQTNSYTSSYLTQIADAAGNNIVTFAYDSATAGKVVRVDTPRGVVGYETSSARTACSGQTVLYFNRGNATSCSVDTDCGAGFLCGGKTGSGATGQCFRAGRCLTLSSPSEDVVTNVAALGPPSQTCDGACTDVAQYVWNTGTTTLDLAAIQDPGGNYTARAFNSNGLPTTVTHGDADSNPSNFNDMREEFLYYDATYPGRIAETRHKSDIQPSLACTSSISTGCVRTLYTYNSDGKLSQTQDIGFTLNSSNTAVGYTYTTAYSYDTKGRLTQIDGALSGANDLTVYEYWSSADPLKDGFLQNFKRKYDSTNYLIQSSLAYDFWGHAIGVTAVDGSVSCRKYDSARGFLSEQREAMAGQSDCTTANGADLVTSWARDSALRITQLTRPDGSCLFYEYGTDGRLARTKRRDDCNAASSGDKQEFTYDYDGLLTKTETFDSSGTVTKRQELAYYDSRRIQNIINPVNTSVWDGLVYDARGLLTEIDAPSSLGKTVNHIDADYRTTSVDRYSTSSAFDTWTLVHTWLNDQEKVTDGDSKATETVRDDRGRIVRLATPDMSYPRVQLYDEADRLVTVIDAYGGGADQKTHTFTFDNVGRPLVSDYAGACTGTSPPPEITRAYDALPTGISCPTGVGCARTTGRLAYVKTSLLCSTSYTDGSLDQETFYSYDDAGRLIREYIRDDSSRTADHQYAWTKNGALSQVTTPSSAVIGWTYGSAGSNSDTDRIAAMWRTSTSTPVADTVLWFPYGPLQQYNQENVSGSTTYRTRITRNLAYRITTVFDSEPQAGGQALHSVIVTEDDKGRTRKRHYSPNGGSTGVHSDSFYLFDEQDRLLCETTSLATSCPTSGSNILNSHSASPPFTAAGDWKKLLRPIAGSTGLTHDFSLATGTHQIHQVNQSDGTPTFGAIDYAYDALGNRTQDDNKGTLTNDARDYTYDQRHNVVNVRGQYYTGSAWHYYDVASAFDAQNRRVFKSYLDETTLVQSQWFFYYDAFSRPTEVRYTPDIAFSSTYTAFQLFWLDNKLVLYWQTDYPSTTTSKRYVGTDETYRPLDMINWGTSSSTRVWAVDPSTWGMETITTGAGQYQPFLFAGQYEDVDTTAYLNDGVTANRPALALNGFRTYDPFTGSYLQPDPLADKTWAIYTYSDSDPVNKRDPVGLEMGNSDDGYWNCHNDSDVLEDGNEVVTNSCHWWDWGTDETWPGDPDPTGPTGPPGGGTPPTDDPLDFRQCFKDRDDDDVNIFSRNLVLVEPSSIQYETCLECVTRVSQSRVAFICGALDSNVLRVLCIGQEYALWDAAQRMCGDPIIEGLARTAPTGRFTPAPNSSRVR